MFRKKKNKTKKNNDTAVLETEKREQEEDSVLGKGVRTLKDLIAPASIDRTENDSHLVVGDKYTRSFIMNGFPSMVDVRWLDHLYNHDGDMDVAVYVNPADDRTALDELTAKITQFEAQLLSERKRGNIRNITRLEDSVADLYQQRRRLEQNYANLFHIQIASTLYADSKEELEKENQKLDNRLKGRKINLMPLSLRQDDGYKTTLPLGKTYINDKFRNFESASLSKCFPFYNSEIYHEGGTFLGVNLETNTPLMLNFYDRQVLNNGNTTVFGQAGSGKTFFVSLLTLRSSLQGVRTTIIDPEGEYAKLTHAVNGSLIYIAPDSNSFINPFDIEEEYDADLKEEIVKVKDKIADLLNLIGVMAGGLTPEQRSIVSSILGDLYYKKFGFTEDPSTLYTNEPIFNEKTGEFVHGAIKKTMPRFSDFHNLLVEYVEEEENAELKRLANTLLMYKEGGVYDMFDCYTSEDLKNFKDSPVVTFDISRLEENVLRPIGMYVALSWTWEKFAKKNIHLKKRIVVDEAWMLVNQNMAGHEYTAAFLENAARRIRKRNGALLVASQNFVEFANNNEGKAVLTNTTVNIFLRQNSTDIDELQHTFKLSDGERNFLLGAKRGQMLIRMNGDSSVGFAYAFDVEQDLITNAMVYAKNQKK